MECIVVSRDGKPMVSIPEGVKITWWMETQYKVKGEVTTETIYLPCRETIVSIQTPQLIRTPVGIQQTFQITNEKWIYFDIPQKSILVTIGEDIADELGLEEVKIEKEKQENKQ